MDDMVDGGSPISRIAVRVRLMRWAGVANRIGQAVEVRHARCCKVALVVILATTTALSLQAFVTGPSSDVSSNVEVAKWAYLAVAAVVAASISMYDRHERLQTYLFALSTMAFGASFVVIGVHPEVGRAILGTSFVTAALIALLEFRGHTGRGA